MDPGHSFLASLESEFRDDEVDGNTPQHDSGSRPTSQPCIRRGETHLPRHPGSEPSEAMAMLSGIHSVTMKPDAQNVPHTLHYQPMPPYNSRQSGFISSINRTFHARRHRLMRFSKTMASPISWYS
jgi:hypothetical protein